MLDQRRDEPLPRLRPRGGGPGGGVGLGGPGAARRAAPTTGRRPRSAPPFSPAKKRSSPSRARSRSASARMPSEWWTAGSGASGCSARDLPDVPAEQRLLHRLRAEQVEGERQHVLVQQHVVVPGDDRLEFRLGPGRRIVPQQRVQHGHEVALARSERAGEERAPAHPGRHRLRDQAQRGVERLGQRGRHDVLVDGAGDRRVLDAVGQPQHVVLGARPLGNVEDVAQQFAHLSLIPRAR